MACECKRVCGVALNAVSRIIPCHNDDSPLKQRTQNTHQRTQTTPTTSKKGANGDATKDFIFDRVDRVAQAGGRLPVQGAFVQALVLARTVLLGY